MKNIRKLIQTCLACPSQWEGEFEDGTSVFVHYRYGFLFVTVPCGPRLFCRNVGDNFGGVMDTEEMLGQTGLKLMPGVIVEIDELYR